MIKTYALLLFAVLILAGAGGRAPVHFKGKYLDYAAVYNCKFIRQDADPIEFKGPLPLSFLPSPWLPGKALTLKFRRQVRFPIGGEDAWTEVSGSLTAPAADERIFRRELNFCMFDLAADQVYLDETRLTYVTTGTPRPVNGRCAATLKLGQSQTIASEYFLLPDRRSASLTCEVALVSPLRPFEAERAKSLITLLSVQEDALYRAYDILIRSHELAIIAANDAVSRESLSHVAAEVEPLKAMIDELAHLEVQGRKVFWGRKQSFNIGLGLVITINADWNTLLGPISSALADLADILKGVGYPDLDAQRAALMQYSNRYKTTLRVDLENARIALVQNIIVLYDLLDA